MNISFALNAEQTEALKELVADYNAEKTVQLNDEEYLAAVVLGIVNDKVSQMFERAASALVNASRLLPYESRIALISQVQSAINS
jgi:hypothetical protein